MGNITIQGDLTGDVPGGEVGGASNLTTAGAIPYVSAAGVLNQSQIYWDTSTGNVGVGFSTGFNEAFEVRKTLFSASGNTYGIRSTFSLDLPTNSYQFAALLGESIIPSGNSSNFNGLVRGTYSYVRHDGTGTIAEAAAEYPIVRVNGSGVITSAHSWYDSVATASTGSIGTMYHLRVSPAVLSDSSSVGTEYGLYIGNITAPVSANRWAIYTVGSTNKIHFSGPIDSDSSMEMNGSSQFRADGSAASPGFATAGNSNMGMFRATSNTLGWSTIGSEKMRLTGVGNLLIGTTTDSNFKLDVATSGSAGTARFYDQTATTGVTKVVVRAGAGQSTSNLQEWQSSAGAVSAQVNSTGGFLGSEFEVSSVWNAGSSLQRMRDTYRINWSSTSLYSGTADIGLTRNTAGVLEVNSGTAGTYRDLILRRSQHNGVTVADLPVAAAGNAGSIQYVTDANATTIGSTVAGGGANKVMVWSDGAAWKIFAS
jgi:hypothetical protein